MPAMKIDKRKVKKAEPKAKPASKTK